VSDFDGVSGYYDWNENFVQFSGNLEELFDAHSVNDIDRIVVEWHDDAGEQHFNTLFLEDWDYDLGHLDELEDYWMDYLDENYGSAQAS
jgi:hypothetical protein